MQVSVEYQKILCRIFVLWLVKHKQISILSRILHYLLIYPKIHAGFFFKLFMYVLWTLMQVCRGPSIKDVRKILPIFDPPPPSSAGVRFWLTPPSGRPHFLRLFYFHPINQNFSSQVSMLQCMLFHCTHSLH